MGIKNSIEGGISMPHPHLGSKNQEPATRKPGKPWNYYSWAAHGQRGRGTIHDRHFSFYQVNPKKEAAEKPAFEELLKDPRYKKMGLNAVEGEPSLTMSIPTNNASDLEFSLNHEFKLTNDYSPPRKG